MGRRNRLLGRLAAGGVVLIAPAMALADFTPNRLAVLDADTSATSTNGVGVRVQEFSKLGTAQSPTITVNLPSGASGTRLTMSADTTNNFDGGLDVSSNGRYLSVAGYNAQAGTATVALSAGARTIGRIDSAGNVDMSTSNTAFSGGGVRGVASADGSRFWFEGAMGMSGVVTAPLGDSGAGTTVQSGMNSGAAALHVFNGLLYGIATKSFFVYSSPGLPTSSENRTNIAGVSFTAGVDFYLLDRDATVAGPDTLYVAGAGLNKFSFDGTNWTSRGSLADATSRPCCRRRPNRAAGSYATALFPWP